MQVASAFVVGDDGLFGSVESESRTLCTWTYLGDIIESEHHVLRRHGDRRTIGGVKNVVALQHQHLCLENGLVAQRKVNGHLVTVEVGVERSTSQGVKLNGLTLDKLGLESLNTKTVKRRGTVEEHRVALHHVF